MIPDSPDALLTRAQAAHALSASGYPVTAATLATKATRGEGPPFQRFGRKPLYVWRDTLAWARGRMTPARPKCLGERTEAHDASAGAVA
jgi:hypothetical protein